MQIDTGWLALLVGAVLPAVTALVTKQSAPEWVKAVVLALLSAVTGTLSQVQAAGGTFHVKQAAISTLVVFATGVISHFGLLKPLGVTGSDGVIQTALPGGVGPSSQPATAPVQEPATES